MYHGTMVLQRDHWLWENHCALKDVWLGSSEPESCYRGQQQQTCQSEEERVFDENIQLLHGDEDSSVATWSFLGLFPLIRYNPFFPLFFLWPNDLVLSYPAFEVQLPCIHPQSKSRIVDMSNGALCAVCRWREVTVTVTATCGDQWCRKSEGWRGEVFWSFLCLRMKHSSLGGGSMRSRDTFCSLFSRYGYIRVKSSQM